MQQIRHTSRTDSVVADSVEKTGHTFFSSVFLRSRFFTTTCGVLAVVIVSIGSQLPSLFAEKSAGAKSADTKTADTAKTTGTKKVPRDKEIVTYINAQIQQSWTDNEIEPSPRASDAKWLRRVYLDLVGHIPSAQQTQQFLANSNPHKRAELVDELLDDPDYVTHWTTIWTNLSIGRTTPRRVSRAGMKKFYREAFAKNRPWNKIVYDLVAARGHFEKNGAVNFLLAQMTMPDKGVQATAKTARLLLGRQVQCTQCHNHPFNKWKQEQFWEMNAFFRQARARNVRKYNPKRGRQEDDYTELLVGKYDGEKFGEVFFEKRNALVVQVEANYFGQKIDLTDPTVDLRQKLATQMTTGKKPLIASAIVNRMWGHFFGYGFTKSIDDMGPHNPPSHPKLLDRLTTEFIKSNYNLKELIRWICNSDAYQLTSRFGKKNEIDNPSIGETALFSHMYVKSLTAEQLYDSLIIATEAHRTNRSKWKEAEQQRQQWLQQFLTTFKTDDNDRPTAFNGTIPQALLLMNGPLTKNALSTKPGSYLYRQLMQKKSDAQKISLLYSVTLGRQPSKTERTKLERLIRNARTSTGKTAIYQDLYWALLNSSEFIFNH